ncbi:hypothetical protein AA0113_g9163 [Alternaria arborescens]|uniref:Large ribosomal subunit protein eL14 domain-containing protein n=2 Tax=Alternaria arborescens TaxID=156630 RepID=A0A4Q4RCC0_9PLEO|nr:hypothetical protein AA0113_g9163 [Alternaria arborescens]
MYVAHDVNQGDRESRVGDCTKSRNGRREQTALVPRRLSLVHGPPAPQGTRNSSPDHQPFTYSRQEHQHRILFPTAHTDEMGDAEITTSAWRLVEVGRVVLFNEGPFEGRLAAIVEIIDHKRVLIDGPSEKAPIPRQEVALAKLSLTPIVIPKLPRSSGVGHVAKKWEEHKVQQKFDESAWAKKRAAMQKRRGLNDFERFKVMKMRKQARFEVQKTFAKIRASAKA